MFQLKLKKKIVGGPEEARNFLKESCLLFCFTSKTGDSFFVLKYGRMVDSFPLNSWGKGWEAD